MSPAEMRAITASLPALEQIWQILIYKGGKTYVERIQEIREGIRRELMKEANGK